MSRRTWALGALLLAACAAPAQLPPEIGAAVDLATRRDSAVAADAGACPACAPPTPRCDAVKRLCVACLGDDDCAAATLCRDGACVPGCSANRRECGDAGSCELDAGVCRGCAADQDCKDPTPVCDLARGRCGACSTIDDRCPDGQYCVVTAGVAACQPGCRADANCVGDGAASGACCNHVCVDTASSIKHCGACGVACAQGYCCAGKCTNVNTDVANCGTCGNVCPANNNQPACMGGKCGNGSCLMGFSNCDGDPLNGCETATGSDIAHCGACGYACKLANATPLCFGGACVVGACSVGYKDCNGKPGDGCEVDTLTDPAHCGVCGQSCAAVPNAVAGCTNGSCVIAACKPGFANCDKNAQNGCEAELAGDAANCGGCGVSCPAGANAMALCTKGACAAACKPGFSDCNNNLADGCEVSPASDGKNCGGCGKVCADPPNATGGCAGGVCGLGACKPGFANCDNNAQNGCELNVAADVKNCGACNKVCPLAAPCVNSVCVVGPACSNGSFTDCNPQGATLLQNSAFVDRTPPQGWVQCAGFVNTVGDDVANTALDNCLSTTRLRLRIFDANDTVVVDVYHEALLSRPAWLAAANYLDGCNCKGALTRVTCNAMYWPCANSSTFYSSTTGAGGGGCGGYAPGGPTISNGNASQLTVAVAQSDGREIWQGMCYGNTQWTNHKAALYR